ncbi:hypothetical protein CTI12_AA543540 [Artemisia annua]|uniref:NB-ARC domains-containing protein n=1 Tax=Artemisia annua TaxID=35608 RepID=A0A2U1L0N0_ARTAN|nr:hypothetical protein CTI12_AA543540 [Artemisia annua]
MDKANDKLPPTEPMENQDKKATYAGNKLNYANKQLQTSTEPSRLGQLMKAFQTNSYSNKLTAKKLWHKVIYNSIFGTILEFSHEIRYLWESEAEASKVLVNLRELEVRNCSKLVSLGDKKKEDGCNQLTSLRIMEVWFCKNLERCNFPNNIQELSMYGCDSIASVSFPTGGHKLKSLKIYGCELLENESFPAAELPNLTSLTHLEIIYCKSMDVDSFGVWPPKLGFLTIGGLKKPISKFGPQNFPPSLVHLTLVGESAEEDDVTNGSRLLHMLPSSLTKLHLYKFEKLETVSKGLQHLTSLQHLSIFSCQKNSKKMM